MNFATVCDFLSDAKLLGYGIASFSGGEPFLYERLGDVARAARKLGFITKVVTNGTLLNSPARQDACSIFDVVAVSVDGQEPLHNEIRRSDTAFSRMVRGLEYLRTANKPFGILHAATRQSLSQLGWLAEFAIAEGASLLQLHPLGIVGAASQLEDWRLSGEDCARIYLTGLALRAKYHDRLYVHIDLFNLEAIRKQPELVVPSFRSGSLKDALNPIVLMSNGDVSPICHAMGPEWRLGNIGTQRLPDMVRRFMGGPDKKLSAFCESLLETLDHSDAWPYVNWYEIMEAQSWHRKPASFAIAAGDGL